MILAIAMGGTIAAPAGEIKLPLDTCPSESIFVYDGNEFFWQFDQGMVSDYYNEAGFAVIKGFLENEPDVTWDGDQCPPMKGHISKGRRILNIPQGHFDDPDNVLTHDEMRKQQPEIFKLYQKNTRQSDV